MMIGEISPYPPKNSLHSGSIGFCAKDLAVNLQKLNAAVVCFADGRKDEYTEDGVMIIRCWRRGVTYPILIFSQVKKHLQHIFEKIGVSSRTALIRKTVEYQRTKPQA